MCVAMDTRRYICTSMDRCDPLKGRTRLIGRLVPSVGIAKHGRWPRASHRDNTDTWSLEQYKREYDDRGLWMCAESKRSNLLLELCSISGG